MRPAEAYRKRPLGAASIAAHNKLPERVLLDQVLQRVLVNPIPDHSGSAVTRA